MKSDCLNNIIGWSMLAIIFSVVIFMFCALADIKSLKKQAIELNYAEHNSKTGEWQWKTNATQIKQ